MSHADVLIWDGDQQQEAGPYFSKYWRFKLCRLVDLRSSIGGGQKLEMVWTGCSTLSHNKYCGNSLIDGVLESSLSVAID